MRQIANVASDQLMSRRKKALCCKVKAAVSGMKRKVCSRSLSSPKGVDTFPSHKRNILSMAQKVNRDCDQTGRDEIKKNVDDELNTDLIFCDLVLHKNKSTCSG